MNSKSPQSAYKWRFFRAGGVDQILIQNGADIARLPELDLKLWFALAMPCEGVEADPVLLAMLDSDKDGRIRPPEIAAAASWADSAFVDLNDLFSPADSIAISRIKDAEIRASARQVLDSLGKTEAKDISLSDLGSVYKGLASTLLNGDGVIPPDEALEPETRQAVADILSCMGGVPDRSSKLGIDSDILDRFFSQAAALVAWMDLGRANAHSLLPAGEGTADALAALNAVRAKVDDFFARVRLADFDPRALEALNRSESEYLALAAKDMTIEAAELAAFPLALVKPGASLPLEKGLNPAWEGAIASFIDKTIEPLIGSAGRLSSADWEGLKSALEPFQKWQAAKPATSVGALGETRLRELLGSGQKARIATLMAEDAALKPRFDRLDAVEKLLRMRMGFVRLLNNYVNFAEFYQTRSSIFLAGDLYLDARACHLCLDVADAGRHAALAGLSGIYLAYCDLRREGGQKRSIVAAFTDGDADNLMPGRNGVFFDRKGRDWDASITKIVSNPISIREAFWSPYKKLQRTIEEMIAKRAAGAEAGASDKLTNLAASAVNLDKAKPDAIPKKIDVGTVAAMGVALGAIGAGLSALATGLMGLAWWQIPLVFVGLVLLISLPSMILAWMKLKRRNIAPLLDANGWAVNTRARINTPFGAAMTDRAKVSARVSGSVKDPFAERRTRWPFVVALLLVVAACLWTLDRRGSLNRWSGGLIGTAAQSVECPARDTAQ